MKHVFLIGFLLVSQIAFATGSRFSWACYGETGNWLVTQEFPSGLVQVLLKGQNQGVTVNASIDQNGNKIFRSQENEAFDLVISRNCVRVPGRGNGSINPKPPTIKCQSIFSVNGQKEQMSCRPAK